MLGEVLTAALAQFLAEQLSCELGKECGIFLSYRQALGLCGAAGKPQGGQCPIGKYEGRGRGYNIGRGGEGRWELGVRLRREELLCTWFQ